jgi:hypothetical protein
VVVENACHLEALVVEKLKPASCMMKTARPLEMAQGHSLRVHPTEKYSSLLSALPPPEARPDRANFPISAHIDNAIPTAMGTPLYIQHHSLLM